MRKSWHLIFEPRKYYRNCSLLQVLRILFLIVWVMSVSAFRMGTIFLIIRALKQFSVGHSGKVFSLDHQLAFSVSCLTIFENARNPTSGFIIYLRMYFRVCSTLYISVCSIFPCKIFNNSRTCINNLAWED